MHYIVGVVIDLDLLFIWVGIYLYLVTANKILTNFKSIALLQPTYLVSLTLQMSSHLW
jgi:Flp pilus assembly CpaE family ATPase